MNFSNLILSQNGGIRTSNDRFGQANTMTLAIGLGGTGIACLRSLKARVYESVQGDNNNDGTPSYEHIKFLAVDTTDTDLVDINAPKDFSRTIDKNTEFFDIHESQMDGVVTHPQFDVDIKYKWYKKERPGQVGISVQNTQHGAAGERQVGRLLLIKNSANFRSAVKNLINQGSKNLKGNYSVDIHIFTGMGGGTGAGTFLDVCYIVKDVLKEIQGNAINKQISGYFFLPDISLARGLANNVEDYIQANGFAAMKDLEYCMSFANNGGRWHQEYDGFTIDTDEKPVDLAHLISSKDSAGRTKKNGFGYAMNAVTEYVMQFIIDSKNGNTAQGFTVKDHITNLKAMRDTVPKTAGACYEYVAVGASTYGIPFKEINTYLASKIFHEYFNDLKNKYPTDINSFLTDAKINLDDIIETVRRDVSFYSMPEGVENAEWCWTLHDQCQSIPALTDSAKIAKHYFPNILTPFRTLYWETAPGERAKNKKDLTAVIADDFMSNGNLISLQARVKKVLINYCLDPDKGPYYAASVIRGNNYSLESAIDGMIETLNGKIKSARADCPELFTLNMALEAVKKSKNKRKAKKNAKNYVSLFLRYCQCSTDIQTYEDTIDVLATFKEQVGKLYDSFFSRLKSVLTEIGNALDNNYKAINAGNIDDNRNFAKWIVSIKDPDFIRELDHYVEQQLDVGVVRRFIEAFILDGSWESSNEEKIYNFICAFFQNELREYRQNHLLQDYLKKKYNQDDHLSTVDYQKTLYQEVIDQTAESATPLFNPAVGVANTVLPQYNTNYYFFPKSVSDLTQAAERSGVVKDSEIYASLNESTLTVLKFASCVPIFDYSELDIYKKKYLKSPSVSLHPHLGAKGATPEMNDPEDWRKDVWDIKPYSQLRSEEITDEIAGYAKQFDNALESGVITYTLHNDSNGDYKDNFKIVIFDEEKVRAVEKFVKDGELEQAAELLGKNTDIPIIDKYELRSIALAGQYKVTTVKDFFISSKFLRELVAKQTDLKNSFNNAIGAVRIFTKAMPDFIDLLIDGVFDTDNGVIKYYSDLKMDEIILTNELSQEFQFAEHLPYYSAYITYLSLSDEQKEELNKMRQVKRENDMAGIKATRAAIKDSFDLRKTIQVATLRYKADLSNIKTFYKRLQDNIDIL